jgi:hypothetical protein
LPVGSVLSAIVDGLFAESDDSAESVVFEELLDWTELAHVAMLLKTLLLHVIALLLTIVIDDDDVEDDGPCVRVAVSCNS